MIPLLISILTAFIPQSIKKAGGTIMSLYMSLLLGFFYPLLIYLALAFITFIFASPDGIFRWFIVNKWGRKSAIRGIPLLFLFYLIVGGGLIFIISFPIIRYFINIILKYI